MGRTREECRNPRPGAVPTPVQAVLVADARVHSFRVPNDDVEYGRDQ